MPTRDSEGLITRGHSGRSGCRITGLTRSLLQYHRRRPVPDREVRRLIVADTITEIHRRSRATCARRRVRVALLADYNDECSQTPDPFVASHRDPGGLDRVMTTLRSPVGSISG